MIAFLQPLALLGLAAAAIPALLHLLARRLPPLVPFPAVRYLTETERQHSRRLKLRNLWLLILRTLLIILIALAASRPIARVPIGGDHEPTALGLIVDNSLSSGAIVDGRRVMDGLVDKAREVLNRTGGEDRVWLVLGDGLPQQISLPDARQLLDTLSPWPVRLDIPAAVRSVSLTMEDAGLLASEIVVLSDLQATAFTVRASAGGDRSEPRVLAWGPDMSVMNRGVDSVQVVPAVWSPSGDVMVSLGGMDETPTTVRLNVNGRDVARSLGTRNDLVILHGSGMSAGWRAATVRLDADELRADDSRHIAIRVAPPAAISAVGAGGFLEAAVAVLQESGRVTTGNDVVFSDRLQSGITILFPPADPALVGAVNRSLAERGVGWQFGPVVEGEWQVSGDGGPGASATVLRRRRLEGRGDGVVLGSAGGDPWLVRDGDVVIVASRMEPGWSTMPISASFVPFLDFLANRVAAAPAWIVPAFPGVVTELPIEVRSVWMADGPVPVSADGRITAPFEPGVYFLQGAGADTIGALEVSHDPRESSLSRVESRVVRASLGERAGIFSTPAFDRELFSGARRANLTGFILVLALIVALAEFALSSAGGAARHRT